MDLEGARLEIDKDKLIDILTENLSLIDNSELPLPK